uniref:Uncharacterized protein n=1 Tax=viral metagenome TaxID=1070528 RepID=A0A6M3IS18_9ZZZZ
MAYSVYTDVTKLLLGMSFSESTGKILTGDITNIIVDVDNWIDAMLSNYYSVPITGTESLLIIKIISKYAAAAEVLRRVTAGIQGTKTDNKTGKEYQKRADDMLSAIQIGTMELTDATKTNASNIVRTGKYDATGELRTAKIKIDEVF